MQLSRSQLLEIFENAPMAMLLVDEEGRVRQINRTGAEVTGCDPEEAVGMLGGEIFRCINAVREKDSCGRQAACRDCPVRNNVARTIAGGKSVFKKEGRLMVSRNGRAVEMAFLVSTTRIGPEGDYRVLVSIDDVTAQRRTEERLILAERYQRHLAAASSELLGALPPADNVHAALRQLMMGSLVSRVSVFENIEDRDGGLCMQCAFEVCAEGVRPEIDDPGARKIPYAKGFETWPAVLSQGKWIGGNVSGFPDKTRAALEARGKSSILVVPVMVQGTWWGGMVFDETRVERRWHEDDIHVLSTAAAMVGGYLGMVAASEKARLNETRLEQILRSVQTGILVTDPEDLRIVEANKALVDMIGLPEEKIVGSVCSDFFCPVEKEGGPVVHKGKAVEHTEGVLLNSEGKKIPVVRTVSQVRLGGRRLLLESLADVSELKQAQQKAQEAEERSRLLLESVGEGIIGVDRAGRISFVNPVATRLLGYGAGEMIGKEIHALIHHSRGDGSPYPKAECPIRESYATGVVNRSRSEVLWRKDNTFFPAECTSTPVVKNSDIIGSVVAFSDITRQKDTEREIKQTHERLEQALRGGNMGLWDWNPVTNEFYANDIFCTNNIFQSMLGYDPDKARSYLAQEWSWAKLIHPDDMGQARRLFIKHLKGETEFFRHEFRMQSTDGAYKWILSTGRVIERNASGKAVRIIGVTMDIHELKQLQEELVSAKEAAEAATRAKSDFLANMSHEIRTPMNAILGLTHLALQTDLAPRQKDYLQKTHLSAENLLGIINDILDFSKIEAGKLDMETRRFNLDHMIDEAVNLVGVKAREKELDLFVDVTGRAPRTLVGDSLRLRQVIVNLLNNAVKFTEQGEIMFRIDVDWETLEEVCLKFSVRDTGIGMTPEQCAGLFNPFEQADTSTSRRFGGTGLGLSICKRLVELMNGRIWVDSMEGRGSTFFFTAVFGRQGSTEGGLPVSESPGTGPVSVIRGFHGNLVLLVEDNDINRQIAYELLSRAGIEVHQARDGGEAVAAAKTARYDLILMDIQMPVLDGYEATREIRGMKACRTLPIIAMTAHAMAGDVEKSMDAGMNGHVAKPIKPEELFTVLSRWIRPKAGKGGAPGPGPRTRGSAVSGNGFPVLPGIDVGAGLELMGGDESLYRKMLGSFAAHYKGFESQLSSAAAGKEWEAAERLAHSMKGVAGNIGARALHEICIGLEKGFRKKSAETWKKSKASFTREIRRLLQSLEQAGFSKERTVIGKRKTGELTARLPQTLTADLARALEGGYSEQLPSILRQIEAVDKDLGIRLSDLADNYEYDRILSLIRKEKQ